MAKKWYKKHWLRLKAEELLINERFPQFYLREINGQLLWEGVLRTNFDTRYLINITYPQNYPYERPVLRIIEPKIRKGTPHIYTNDTLCVYPNGWNHKKCTAPAGIPLVAAWLAMYESWLRSGKRW